MAEFEPELRAQAIVRALLYFLQERGEDLKGVETEQFIEALTQVTEITDTTARTIIQDIETGTLEPELPDDEEVRKKAEELLARLKEGGGPEPQESSSPQETIPSDWSLPQSGPVEPVKKRYGKVDITPKGEVRFYATGRRKEAIARVWLIPDGSGQITVNDRPLWDYIHGRVSLYEHVLEPLRVTKTLGLFDIKATARGGGVSGQAGALQHGIARALAIWKEELRPILKKAGLLTRDPRAKERKKYGRKRARRGFQFRKR